MHIYPFKLDDQGVERCLRAIRSSVDTFRWKECGLEYAKELLKSCINNGNTITDVCKVRVVKVIKALDSQKGSSFASIAEREATTLIEACKGNTSTNTTATNTTATNIDWALIGAVVTATTFVLVFLGSIICFRNCLNPHRVRRQDPQPILPILGYPEN